jgi:hypothetical protein
MERASDQLMKGSKELECPNSLRSTYCVIQFPLIYLQMTRIQSTFADILQLDIVSRES